jgi:hypothetical protein
MRTRLPGLALMGVLSVVGAGALAQAEADRRLDAAIARLRAALGPDSRLEIGGRSVDPVSGHATLTNVVLSQGPNHLTVPELRLAEVSEARIGRAELLRSVYRGAEGATGEVARVLLAGMPVPAEGKALEIANLAFEALEVEAVRMDDPAKGALRLERLEVRDFTPQGVGAGLLNGFEFRDRAADGQMMRLGRVELASVTLPMRAGDFDPVAFRAGRIAVEDAALRDPDSSVTIGLGRLALQDWVPGRVTSLAVERLQLATPAGGMGAVEFSLARFDAAGIDAAQTLEAVMGGIQVPDPQPGTPQRVLLEGLQANWEGQPLLALARLLTEGSLQDGIARGGMVAEGLRVVPPAGRADWLEALGYREIAGGWELRGNVPRAGGRLEIAPFRIGWEQAGALSLAAQLDGMPALPAEGTAVDPDATAAQLTEARLAGLTLALRDQGLLGRVLARQAREQRMPEARLREQWAQMALAIPMPGERPQRGQRGGPPPAPAPSKGSAVPSKGAAQQAAPAPGADPLPPIRQAIASFIRQPGTLEITLRPPTPLSFAEMGNLQAGGPVQAIQRLGLSIVAR